MTIQDIKTFCKASGTPLTAVKCNPSYNEKKGRVTKGDIKVYIGWKDKNRYDASKTAKTPFETNNATMMLIHLKPLKLYCFDVDVCNGRTYKDVLKPEMLEEFQKNCSYIVETGSKGAHFYFKLSDDFVGKVTNYINVDSFSNFFKDDEKDNATMDVIMDSVITEGSSYTYESINYNYTLIKGHSLSDCTENIGFQAVYDNYLKKEVTESVQSKYQYITIEEVVAHINNIPNNSTNIPNYDAWYRIGQLIYNLLGYSGFDLFNDWSNTNPISDVGYTYSKWRGLRNRMGSDVLGVGTLKYLSKKSNPTEYNNIIKLYSKDAFLELIVKADSHEVAKYFRVLKPHSYITKDKEGWYVLQSNNTWSVTIKKPQSLLNDIADTFKIIVDEHLESLNKEDDNEAIIKKLVKFRTLVGTKSIGESVGDYLYSMYYDDKITEKMDENRNLFAFLDKVVNLDTGEVTAIEAEDYISITTGYNYPMVMNSVVRKEIMLFLYSLFEDDEMVRFEINKLSYALHGNKKYEFFTIETGDGRNGKGTKGVIVKKAFGNYYKSIPISLLTQGSDKKDVPLPALVACRGMRYIEAQEPEAKDRLNTGLIKEMTGGDIITCRGLYGNILYFVLQGLLNIQANGIPKYNKYDNAIAMRNVVQPFPFIFVSSDIKELKNNERYGDNNIKKKVSTDIWRDEFILMLLENYQLIKDNKTFHIPDIIKKRTQDNADENIPIKSWYDKYTKVSEGEIKNTVLYDSYKQSSRFPCSIQMFNSYMKLLNVENRLRQKISYWVGIDLKEDSEIEVNSIII